MTHFSSVDLGHGAGSASIALALVGFEVLWANDTRAPAALVYDANLRGICRSDERPERADLVVLSSTTQDVSAREILRLWPKVIVSARKPPAKVLSLYDSVCFSLNSCFYGVPESKEYKLFLCTSCADRSTARRLLLQAHKAVQLRRAVKPMAVRELFGSEWSTFLFPREGRVVHSTDLPCPALAPSMADAVGPGALQPGAADSGPIEDARRLGLSEVGQIHGFPSDFDWSGLTDADAVGLLCDSVPPPVWCAVLESVAAILPLAVCPQMGVKGATGVKAGPRPKSSPRFDFLKMVGGRVEFFATGRQQVVCVTGRSAQVDAAVAELTGGRQLPKGWSVIVRQRRSGGDDVYWRPPRGVRILKTQQDVFEHIDS